MSDEPMNLVENYPIEMRSLLKRMKSLYNKPNAKTISEALPDDYIGHTFVPKGAVAAVTDLPATGNTVGDLYHVEEDQSEYVWLPTTEFPNGHWENVGPATGGSDNTFKVTFTFTYGPAPDYAMVISCDKTLEEIDEAYDAGKLVYAVDGTTHTYILQDIDLEDGICRFVCSNGATYSEFYVPIGSDEWHFMSDGLEPSNNIVQNSSSSITLDLAADNTIYAFQTVASLTVTAIPVYGSFIIRFKSGSTPTVTNFPADMKFPEAFAAEANTRYEINCVDGYALVASWPVS